jgi:dihydroxyacetone kinase-like protein
MSFKLNAQDIKKMIEKLALVFENQKDYLNELDSKIGDGDHRLSMSRGFSAITKYIQKNDLINIADILVKGGIQFNEATGSTIGILIFSAMRSAGLAIKNKEFIDLKDLSVMFDEAIKAIIKTGKASVGQKTILDTFMPTFKFFSGQINNNLKKDKEDKEDDAEIIKKTIAIAYKSTKSTEQMKSNIGRAKWFSNRSLGIIDPGAFSGYLIIKTIGEFILEKMNE